MTSAPRQSSSEAVAHLDTSRSVDARSLNRTARGLPDCFPTLDQLLEMPLGERDAYLRQAAELVADDYEDDPSMTELTCLDSEDFEGYPEQM